MNGSITWIRTYVVGVVGTEIDGEDAVLFDIREDSLCYGVRVGHGEVEVGALG
jgi:hypothetical protein